MEPRTPFSPVSCRLRRLALRANLLAILLLACAIFGMVNYLSMRHYARVHWNRILSTRLSGKSLQVLESVPADIRVVALLRPAHAAYRSATALLQEYTARFPNVSVELVDPDRDMARAEQIAGQYHLTGSECVVFEVGGRHQAVPAAELIETGPAAAEAGQPRPAFRGEQLFSSAIYSLTQATRPVVHFIQGHGEHSPLDFDRRSGYSRIASRLRDENLEVELLNLGETKAVPNQCALMVVAGPVLSFTPFEVALIRDYLARKGRLLLLLDARTKTGLDSLLLEWGLLLGDDIVTDETRTLSGRELYTAAYPDHPITAPLQNLASVLFLPRALRLRPVSSGGDKPAVSALVTCSAQGWAEFDPDDASVHFDPQVDIAGPIPVAVAIERGPVPGVRVQIRPTRLVVIGDSDFASNSGIMGANADLFLNSVNWLLDREELLALSPKPFEKLHLVMDAGQLQKLFWAVVVVLPGIVAALGLWVAWRRRH
jgi:ABC-type uncharacterized transport system involved in gliding motility auxiliary subunit